MTILPLPCRNASGPDCGFHAKPIAGPKFLFGVFTLLGTVNVAGSSPEYAGKVKIFAGWPKFSYRRPGFSVKVGVIFQLSCTNSDQRNRLGRYTGLPNCLVMLPWFPEKSSMKFARAVTPVLLA